jgi:DNA-binding protein YbaB
MQMTDGLFGAFSTDAADFEKQRERFAAMRERAEQVQRDLAGTDATVSSQDQSVTITVGAGGIMKSLRFGPRADRLPMATLASTIMTTYTHACRDVAGQAADLVESLTGGTSTTSALMREAIPADPDDDGSDRRR